MKLVVKDIKAYGHHGYFEEERRLGQWFKVDVAVEGNERAMTSDCLDDCVDYRTVVAKVNEIVTGEGIFTVEGLLGKLLSELKSSLHNLQGTLEVTVTKLSPPIPDYDGVLVVSHAINL